MKCEFCKTEIASDAAICPHCRKATEIGRANNRGRVWTTALVLISVPLAIFAAMAIYGSTLPEEPRFSMDRIEAACAREYPGDRDRQMNCTLALVDKKLEQIDGDRLKRAEADAGVR